MSDLSNTRRELRRFRTHALATATAVALAAIAAPAMAAEPVQRVNMSSLEAAPSALHDRFIVKYRDPAGPASSGQPAEPGLRMAHGAIGRVQEFNAAGRSVRVRSVRKLAVGGNVLKADRKLDRVEAA